MTDDVRTVVEWIRANCHQVAPHQPLKGDTRLLDDGLLDSLQIVQLVTFLEAEFGVAIDLEELTPENFETPECVAALIRRMRPPQAAAA